MSGTLHINLEISHAQAFMCFTPRSPPVFFKPKHTTPIVLMGQQFSFCTGLPCGLAQPQTP